MDHAPASRSSLPRFFAIRMRRWLMVLVIICLLFGWFVVKPVVEGLATGLVNVAIQTLGALGPLMQQPYALACQQIEQNEQVQDMLGAPLTFAPLEKTTWQSLSDSQDMEVTIEVSGWRGSGEARLVVRPSAEAFELQCLTVTGPMGEFIELPVSHPNAPEPSK
jgi:hypothetical protein